MTSTSLQSIAQEIGKIKARDSVLNFFKAFDSGAVEEMITLLDTSAVMDPCNTVLYGDVFTKRLEGFENIRTSLRELISGYKTHHTITNLEVKLGGSSEPVAIVEGKFEGRRWKILKDDPDSEHEYSTAGGTIRFKLIDHHSLGWLIQYINIETLFSNLKQSSTYTMVYRVP